MSGTILTGKIQTGQVKRSAVFLDASAGAKQLRLPPLSRRPSSPLTLFRFSWKNYTPTVFCSAGQEQIAYLQKKPDEG
jgi:hypothetical protein